MEVLKKNIEDKEDPRKDNSDKKPLFEGDRKPKTANEHKDTWHFIQDKNTRENIAYQMQYLEFQVHLYNDYQIYLTIESLICKNIMAVIAGVVESALSWLVGEKLAKEGYLVNDKAQFLQLIDDACKFEIIDRGLQNDFHKLRKMRNLVHLNSVEYQEHSAYNPKEANHYIEALNRFIELQTK